MLKILLSLSLLFLTSSFAFSYEETFTSPSVSDVDSAFPSGSTFIGGGGGIPDSYVINAVNGYCNLRTPSSSYVSHSYDDGNLGFQYLYNTSRGWWLSSGSYGSVTLITCENGQTLGCTDPSANNYSPSATENDGSCSYDQTITPNSFYDFDSSYLFDDFGYSGYDYPTRLTTFSGGVDYGEFIKLEAKRDTNILLSDIRIILIFIFLFSFFMCCYYLLNDLLGKK